MVTHKLYAMFVLMWVKHKTMKIVTNSFLNKSLKHNPTVGNVANSKEHPSTKKEYIGKEYVSEKFIFNLYL